MGVRRALNLTLDAANDPSNARPITTIGPLIHNRQVLEVLDAKGIATMSDHLDGRVGTAIIRAHGITPRQRERLGEGCQKVIDATCPHVRKVQRIAQQHCEDGYWCVVVGDPGHAEVEGVLSYAGGRGLVVSSAQEVARLPEMDKVIVVAQTTQSEETFSQVAEAIRRRYPQCRVFNTVCRSTQRRQAEARRLAREVEAMVVVGGFNSANTRRLAETCARTGTPTFHVETEQQLDAERLLQYRRIGVTAGASTPHWMIRRVLRRIRSEHGRRGRSMRRLMRFVLSGPIRTNVFLGGGAAAMTFACWRLIGASGGLLGHCMALAFFFIMAQHLLNQYSKRKAMYLNDPDRGEFFEANAHVLLALSAAGCALALFLALLLGRVPFMLMLVGTAAGLLYRFAPSKGTAGRLFPGSLKRIPGSKELFVGLAWAVTAALVPALAADEQGGAWRLAEHWKGVSVAGLFAFLAAFQRTLLTDLRDVEGDQLVGRETIAALMGQRASKPLMVALLAAQAVVLAGLGGLLGWTTGLSYVMLAAVVYYGFCVALFHKGQLPESELGEALVDGKFYACGLLALVSGWLL